MFRRRSRRRTRFFYGCLVPLNLAVHLPYSRNKLEKVLTLDEAQKSTHRLHTVHPEARTRWSRGYTEPGSMPIMLSVCVCVCVCVFHFGCLPFAKHYHSESRSSNKRFPVCLCFCFRFNRILADRCRPPPTHQRATQSRVPGSRRRDQVGSNLFQEHTPLATGSDTFRFGRRPALEYQELTRWCCFTAALVYTVD